MPRIRAASIGEHKELTRAQVLEEAERLFGEYGYEQVSLGDVAGAVGIGRTTLYDYFRDKEDLLATLVEEILPATIERMVRELPERLSWRDRLAALSVAMVDFVATDPTLGLILHREVAKLSTEAQDRVGRAHRGLSTEFVTIYQGGVEAGELKALPYDLVGRFLQDLIMSAAKALIDSPDPGVRRQEVTDAMVSVLLSGMGT
ncbi:MAG: TetR/AcrR family transcriptional regulator [Acidimicrobiia bacterium]|nr:TetR/AcrR family transcriptional regulator [Acidimicrobiia bacterium]